MSAEFVAFQARAKAFLSRWCRAEALSHAESAHGFWHPTGFMTFHTSVSFEAMPVRVHCWPQGARPVEAGHPPLHTHIWPLVAKVLVGTYSEALYQLAPSPDGELVRYTVEYHSRDDATVHQDGARFTIKARMHRAYMAGDVHGVEAGVWHETTIAESERVVTVMVTGRPRFRAPQLAGPSGFPSGRRVRRAVPRGRFLEEFGDLLE